MEFGTVRISGSSGSMVSLSADLPASVTHHTHLEIL